MLSHNGHPRKALIVRLGSLGDIIHTIPAQQQLVRRHPSIEIHWLTEPPYQDFLRQVKGVSRVWTADTQRWRRRISSLRELGGLLRQLRRQNFDLAVDFQGLLKSAVLTRLSGAEQVLGFATEQVRERASLWLYTQRVPVPEGRHVIQTCLDLVNFPNQSQSVDPRIELRIPEPAARYVDRKLAKLSMERPILINPGAGWETKLYPAGDYSRLADRIQQQLHLPVILTYGPGEESLIERVRAGAKHPVRSFPTSVLQLAALCRRARLLIGTDTGPLHLAVALGTPTVALLGPTPPWRNGPLNSHDQIVRRDLPCSNCHKRTCDEFICMDISVDTLLKAVVRRLEA